MSPIVRFVIIALVGATLSSLAAAQDPQAQPQAQPATGIPIDQVPTTCTKEIYQNPLFSIADAPRVVEGNDLAFPIVRRYDDGCSHRVLVDFPDKSQLVQPPGFVDVPPGDGPHLLQVHTKADAAANGDRTVEVQLRDVQGGDIDESGRVAHGVIADPPPPELPKPTSYAIGLQGQAVRGQPLIFVVTRSGPLPAADVNYDIAQGGQTRRSESPVVFAEGSPSAQITLSPPDGYSECGGAVQVSLVGVTGDNLASLAVLAGEHPAWCRPPPRPWWPWVVGAIAAIAVGSWIWRRLHPPEPGIDEEILLPGPEPEGPESGGDGPEPAPPITADCAIKPGAPRLSLSDGAIGRWPPIETHVTFERGISSVPVPLPIAESEDG